jgi:ribonuclease P protein component
MPLVTLKKRHEFLRLRGGVRSSNPAFLIEGKLRSPVSSESNLETARKPRNSRPGTEPVEGPILAPAATQSASSGAIVPGRSLDGDGLARFGFTVTKKLGCAVVRNRIRRKLRDVARLISDAQGLPGCDYVIVARDAALRRGTADLQADLEKALVQINRKLTASRR